MDAHRFPWRALAQVRAVMNSHRRTTACLPAKFRKRAPLAAALAAGLGIASLSPALAFTPLTASQLVFVNVDHAPVGAGSTLAYGYKGDTCGLGTSSTKYPFHGGGGGVVIGLKSSAGLKVMPFVASAASVSSTASFFADADVQRTLGPCTDQWTVQSGALSWTHYTPAWKMPSLSTATVVDKRRFFLPATWMVFTVNNTTGAAEDFYFGLPASASTQMFSGGAYQGFATGEAALAVKAGAADLLIGSSLSTALNGLSNGFAFHLSVPAGQTKSLTVVVAYYRNAVVDSRVTASYYYKTLFNTVDDVIDTAMASFTDAQTRCAQLATAMQGAALNPYRQFLASDTLHSFQASTLCLVDPSGTVYWREFEGDYQYVNTFDLTVDHAFYDSIMHPWVLRNVLDAYSGASNGGVGYTFDHPLYDPATLAQVSATGFSFHHDMGGGLTSLAPTVDPTGYESAFSYMGQEQLQNWILSAGLYWKRSSDNAWLTSNATFLQTCLTSMLLRDDVTAGSRDGITSYINVRSSSAKEITTYDSLDASLKQPDQSGRTTVRSWACYLALQSMFTQLGDTSNAATAGNMATLCANTIVSKWNAYSPSLTYIPAFLNGANTAATIPLIEGLAYPLEMGLTTATSLTGPYSTMLLDLKSHMTNILVSGKCLDATTGGWKLSSSTTNTWQSKVYLCQYEAEKVLGLTGNTVNGTVDQIHATFQMDQAPYQGWSDQFDSRDTVLASQSLHYPRGITSILWWLTPATNPAFPSPSGAPGAPTGVTALASTGQVVLNWNSPGQATSFTVKRATASGGPYTTLVTGLTGASLVDYTIVASGTYYYTVTASNSSGTGAASAAVSAAATVGALPASWTGQDIGAVSLAGGHNYSATGNAFGITASGADIQGTADAFHFVSEPVSGDCSVIARVSMPGLADPWSKAGLMLRESTAANSPNVAIVLSRSNGVSLQWRGTAGGPTSYVPNPYVQGPVAPYYVMLTRSGNTFTGSQSPDGATWTTVGTTTVALASNALIGCVASSHNNTVLNSAAIDSVLLSVLPSPWATLDIGAVGVAGSTYFSPDGTYTVSGSGADISGGADAFRYVYKPMNGNCTIVAEVEAIGNVNEWAKAGVMIRESTAANSTNAAIVVTPSRGVSFQWRTTTGGGSTYTPNPYVAGITAPYFVKLVRSGTTFTASRSPDGVAWTTVGSTTITMGANVLVGLPVTAHDNTKLNPSVIDNITITSP